MGEDTASLVLRLAGPLQSWGTSSQYNRRDTAGEPTKSGLTGLLAAAQGRRRTDPIEDLLRLRLAVRTDRPGSLLRDYHTVSDYRDRPLLSAAVDRKGRQKPTSTGKKTHVTERFYLQDAVFVAAIAGPVGLLTDLAAALRHPAFPIALGRRCCVPTHPLHLTPTTAQAHQASAALWAGTPLEVLGQVPWQGSPAPTVTSTHSPDHPAVVDLPVILDDDSGGGDSGGGDSGGGDSGGGDVRTDVPRSYAPTDRGFSTRRVRHTWVQISTPLPDGGRARHDPFALLGW